MPNVYFKKFPSGEQADVSALARMILESVMEREKIVPEKKIPLKVHFGEKGNRTYLPASTYDGIIDFLNERGIESCFIETSVLYGGERFSREKHTKLALSHGFSRIPVVIADGANGEDACDIPVAFKHFKSCSIARELADSPQVLVLSHFKGHMLAGFGGAIKQLSMGFASKGGKMAMHMGVKPRIRSWWCRGCGLCVRRCNAGAIAFNGKKAKINHDKCIGCGACFSICPHGAVSILSLSGFWNALFKGKFFREKLVEYAAASHTGKKNIYITFVMNVTKGCDCEPRPMRPCIPDIGIFASLDPVAIDQACFDTVRKAGRTFRGEHQLAYAEKIGLGSRAYTIVTL